MHKPARDQWISWARSLLEGVFGHAVSQRVPLRFSPAASPTYRSTRPEDAAQASMAELAETVVRTFCLAAPLIHDDPDISLNGLSVRDCYAQWVLEITAPPGFGQDRAGLYDELGDSPHQQTIECGLLACALWLCEDEVWNRYAPSERNQVAAFMKGHAQGSTVMQNWRVSNMIALAFLHRHGYETDKSLMRHLAKGVALDYAGDGWYRDGKAFDWYNAWAYHAFLPLWCLWYGRDEEPKVAAEFERATHAFCETLPALLDDFGRMPMWGRSATYRCALVGALFGRELLSGSEDPAQSRILMEGCVRQFLDCDCVLADGLLTRGFYGEFPAAVQSYSCIASPYWAAMAFWCLRLPADHPFWDDPATEPPRHGAELLDSPGIAANRLADGSKLLRTGKVLLSPNDEHATRCYAKLAYHTSLPWATHPDERRAEVEPMEYRIVEVSEHRKVPSGSQASLKQALKRLIRREARTQKTPHSLPANAIAWAGMAGEVLYRRAFYGLEARSSWEWVPSIHLADVAMPDGLLRIDRPALPGKTYRIALSSSAFPAHGAQIEWLSDDTLPIPSRAVAITTADEGAPYRMAMTIWGDWKTFDVAYGTGNSPAWEESVTAFSMREIDGATEAPLLISQVIARKGGKAFSKDELFPIAGIVDGLDPRIKLRDGRILNICHRGKNGRLSI